MNDTSTNTKRTTALLAIVALLSVLGVLAFPASRSMMLTAPCQLFTFSASAQNKTGSSLPKALARDQQAQIAFAAIGPDRSTHRYEYSPATMAGDVTATSAVIPDQRAICYEKPSAPADRLYALLVRNPASPPVAAAFLRYAAICWTTVPSDTPDYFYANPLPLTRFDTPEHRSEYMQTAARFERLYPANAYFAVFHGIGFCLVGSDSDALAELHRAAVDRQWQDYLADEGRGRLKLEGADSDNDTWVYNDELVQIGMSFVENTALGDFASYAQSDAGVRQQAGNPQSALDICNGMILVGSKIRCHSTLLSTSVVGANEVAQAGTPPTWKYTYSDTALAHVDSAAAKKFERYASANNRADVASLYGRELPAGARISRLQQRAGLLSMLSIRERVRDCVLLGSSRPFARAIRFAHQIELRHERGWPVLRGATARSAAGAGEGRIDER